LAQLVSDILPADRTPNSDLDIDEAGEDDDVLTEEAVKAAVKSGLVHQVVEESFGQREDQTPTATSATDLDAESGVQQDAGQGVIEPSGDATASASASASDSTTLGLEVAPTQRKYAHEGNSPCTTESVRSVLALLNKQLIGCWA
jgi:hypothetical protein